MYQIFIQSFELNFYTGQCFSRLKKYNYFLRKFINKQFFQRLLTLHLLNISQIFGQKAIKFLSYNLAKKFINNI